jgi:hypothetical protein
MFGVDILFKGKFLIKKWYLLLQCHSMLIEKIDKKEIF